MDKPTLESAQSILDLAEAIIPMIERTWGCIIALDNEVLQEAAGRALLTIGHVGMEDPNEIKQAGHYAFWIRKLKPLSVVNLDELVSASAQLAEKGLLRGSITAPQSIIPHARRLYLNEAFALIAAIGIAKNGGYDIELNAKQFNDLTVSLRYHSFSPSALSALLMAYVK
ncbi:MAG: hypothetical protein ACM31L_02475 [Actinomycetota bacterium]